MAKAPGVLPVTPENAGQRIELGLNAEIGVVAFKPDPSPSRYELIQSSIPTKAFKGFRYNQYGPRFSIVELSLRSEDRVEEIVEIADGVVEAWTDRWGTSIHVDRNVRLLGEIPLLDQAFFAKQEQKALEPGPPMLKLARPLPA